MSNLRAAVVGLAGPELLPGEAARLLAWPPAGIILFRRNISDPTQLQALIAELRSILAPEAVLMLDQEGGRVARLRPPHWRAHPACATLGSARAAWLQGALIGAEARAAGFDVVTAPVLDLRHNGASDVVGDRAFAADSATVARLGSAMAAGLLAAGVQPVAKHAPGHGRARVDSHLALPVVDGLDEDELRPFAACLAVPWWMTAHVVYAGIDTEPATLSARILRGVIRDRLGYGGLLISDDLAMGALGGGPLESRAIAALAAGCDLALYCPGDAIGTEAVLRAVPPLSGAAQARLRAARSLAGASRQDLAPDLLAAERETLGVAA